MNKLKSMLFLAMLFAILQLVAGESQAKYVFLFIGDGMSENIRSYYQRQFPENALDDFPVTVLTGTDNVSGKVTDSAASGTAIACGIKTYNGAIGMDNKKNPVTSLAKIFRDQNRRVGIITSVGLNDATPAAHYANRPSRKDYAGILSDLFASDFDFFAGGWLAYPANYTQKQYIHLLKQAKYEFRDKLVFDEKAPFKRVVYIEDMTPAWPDKPQSRHLLAETTAFAAEKLSRNGKGFFIVVEGGAIDHRAHGNDLAGVIREMHEFDTALKTALEFMQKHPGETLIVVTSDHDTGGMNIVKEIADPLWQNQTIGSSSIESEFQKLFPQASNEELIQFLCKKLAIGEFTASEKELMQQALTAQRDPELRKSKNKLYRSMYGSYNPVVIQAMRIRDARCGITWESFSHTNRKVLTNAIGSGAEYFKSVKENSDIASAISMAAFGKDFMPEARKHLPHPVVKKAEEYYNFISAGCNTLTFRYAQQEPRELEFVFNGGGKKESFTRKIRAGRIEIKDLDPATEYTMTVKADGKVIARAAATTSSQPTGKLIARIGMIADPHVSLDPDVRYGRMLTQSVPRLEKAFSKLQAAKVDFVVMPGDITDASKLPELQATAKVVKKFSDLPIYAVPGNHDRMNEADFSNLWVKTFGPASRLEKRGKLQLLLLDTYNGLLADKADNIKAIEALDPALPVIVISHYQLTPDSRLTDSDRAIHDLDCNGNPQKAPAELVAKSTPELAEKAASLLKKLSGMQGVILVGHKNTATWAKLGNLMQLNLPQLTQYPAGFIYAELYTDGLRIEYRPGLSVFYEEYSRLRGAFYGIKNATRDSNSLTIWNAFYKLDLSQAL